MNEKVGGRALRGYEAESLGGVVPFDCSGCHNWVCPESVCVPQGAASKVLSIFHERGQSSRCDSDTISQKWPACKGIASLRGSLCTGVQRTRDQRIGKRKFVAVLGERFSARKGFCGNNGKELIAWHLAVQ